MIDKALDAVIEAIRGRDLDAVREFSPEILGEINKPLVCVGVKSCGVRSSGLGDYLGTGLVDGREQELYGYRLELTLGLDIFSGSAGELQAACQKLNDRITGLPKGFKRKVLTMGKISWDGETELFTCPCSLSCQAFLTRAGEADTGEFTDFNLKGAYKNHEC